MGRKILMMSLVFAVMFIAVSASTRTAHAAGFNLTTSPLPVELVTTPGVPITRDLRVQNSGTDPVKIKVGLLKFKSSGSNGQPTLMPRQPGDDYFDWVSFSKTSFVANPGAWNTVTMTVSPPKDAAFGYYYAVVFQQDTSGDAAPAPNSGKLNGASATLILLDVKAPGDTKKLTVASFTSDKKLYEYLPANFKVTVHNSGKVHLVPFGNIFISRDHKHTIAVLSVNENQGNVLPNSSRNFQVAWSDGFPVYTAKKDNGQIVTDKSGKQIMQLDWNFSHTNKLRFGKYYAHLTMIYDDGTKDVPVDAEVSFWVVPWKVLPVVVVAIAFLGIGVWVTLLFIFRRFRKNKS